MPTSFSASAKTWSDATSSSSLMTCAIRNPPCSSRTSARSPKDGLSPTLLVNATRMMLPMIDRVRV
jgi:hypothetical protein